MEHLGYKWFLGVLAAQIEGRKVAVFTTPLKAMDQVLEQEFAKGEIQGLVTASRLIPATVETIDHLINMKIEESKNEH